MKFRAHGNAIRFRLNRREVEQFEQTGRISATVEFPGGGALNYSLASGGETLSAIFDGSTIRVNVPQSIANQWTRSNDTGMNASVALENGRKLEIAVEKDFQCLHKGEAARDPDAYPNPAAV